MVLISEQILTPKELFEFANSEIAQKNHAFIPGGENINNLIIHQKEVVLSIEHVMPGSLYACFYDDE